MKEEGKELLVLIVVAAMVAVATVAELLRMLLLMRMEVVAGPGLQVVANRAGLHQASGEEGD